MIHSLIARSVHYPVVHFYTFIRFRSTEFPYLAFTKAFLPHSHFNTSCLNQRLAPASIMRYDLVPDDSILRGGIASTQTGDHQDDKVSSVAARTAKTAKSDQPP